MTSKIGYLVLLVFHIACTLQSEKRWEIEWLNSKEYEVVDEFPNCIIVHVRDINAYNYSIIKLILKDSNNSSYLEIDPIYLDDIHDFISWGPVYRTRCGNKIYLIPDLLVLTWKERTIREATIRRRISTICEHCDIVRFSIYGIITVWTNSLQRAVESFSMLPEVEIDPYTIAFDVLA